MFIKASTKGITAFSIIAVLFVFAFVLTNYVLPSYAQQNFDEIKPISFATSSEFASLNQVLQEPRPQQDISDFVLIPEITSCGRDITYTIDVTKNAETESPINQVWLYNGHWVDGRYETTPPHNNFQCGPAPNENWTLFDLHPDFPICQYLVKVNKTESMIYPGDTLSFTFSANTTTQSNYNWSVETYDNGGSNGFWESENLSIRVDCTPPTTTVSFTPPFKIQDGVTWIDGISTVVLSAQDEVEHDTGIDYTRYRISGPINDDACRSMEACSFVEGFGEWNDYTGPIGGIEESCHVIEYFSADNVGNEEYTNKSCFFVDKTPPILTKDNGNAIIGFDSNPPVNNENNAEGEFHYISPTTPITFNCSDQQPHPSEGERVCFNIGYDMEPFDLTPIYSDKYNGQMTETGFTCVTVDANNEFELEFNSDEDSTHNITYYCRDAVFKKTDVHIQWYKVDSTPPVIEKNMFGSWLGDCPSGTDLEHGDCYVANNGMSGVNISAHDVGHASDLPISCSYQVWWNSSEGWQMVDSGDFNNYTDVIFTEDSMHNLTIDCSDAIGNMVHHEETFLVDSTPPVTTKMYGDPHYPEPVDHSMPHWITSNTPVHLDVADNKVGVENTYYRVTLMSGDEACQYNSIGEGITSCDAAEGSGDWASWDGNFTVPEQSCHLVEYYSIDRLGNNETAKRQCVFVDNTIPMIDKTVGDPKVVKNTTVEVLSNETLEVCHDIDNLSICHNTTSEMLVNITIAGTYITTQTPITFTCNDQEPHPVNHASLCWKVRLANESWPENFSCVDNSEQTITIPEQSVHEIEYYCADALGNVGEHQFEVDIVDTTSPMINTTVVGPYVGDCSQMVKPLGFEIGTSCIIDGVTTIHVEALDQEPHPVGNVSCSWEYHVEGTDITGGGTNTSSFDINFPEESLHALEITCWDELGNSAEKYELYQVDKTAPNTTKTYSGPLFVDGMSEWISNKTMIMLNATDEIGPHVAGVNATYYRYSIVDDTYCNGMDLEINDTLACDNATGFGDWNSYSGSFNIPEQSCHLIEYYSVDNVNKTESAKRQCAFVDNTAPLPDKTVGEPKEVWDGKDANYYDIEEFCQTPGNCWNVTILTPITLGCADPQPHPVGNEQVWINVELDGEDVTSHYCTDEEIGLDGEYNNETGYCLIDTDEFYFHEESEHNLKFFCEDALGNVGPIDDEKFKVRGSGFNITLNKKWNLISVPYVLLGESMHTVFDANNNTIMSVWTYDSVTKQWYVYSPDGIDNDNLDNMLPGWGYWVLAKNNTSMLIGGSLFSPIITPPEKEVVGGWNLIGYYGNKRMFDFEDELLVDPVELDTTYTGPPAEGDRARCALGSLVDTSHGFPTWRSLWTYWEPLNPNQWIPLGTDSRMDPGAGYWLYNVESGGYAPSTTCAVTTHGMEEAALNVTQV